MKNFKGAIFDLDGTLLDSMNLWCEVDEAFFSSRNLVLLSKSLSEARLLFARSTISSAYLMHGTPLFKNSWSNSLR